MADRSGGRVVKAVAVTAAASTQRSLRRQLCPPHLQSRDVVFSGCTLRLTAFGIGRYRNVDLRGNDLSTVRGIPHLTRARIGPGQQHDLIQALVTELEITVEGD